MDETSRANGFRWGGVTVQRIGEGTQPVLSLPRFRLIEFSPIKIMGLCVATEELVRDADALDGFLRRAYASEMAFVIGNEIIAGTGTGQCLGMLNSPAFITVAKETGQAAGTIVAVNVEKMWARLPAPCRKRAVWLVNEDVDLQLSNLATVIGMAGAISPDVLGMYTPAGAFGNEFPLLKGRRVHVVEQCPALGTLGDIILADMSQYFLNDGGPQPAISMHVQWLNFQAVFRFTQRVDGKPAWTAPITPANGTATRSPFVALAQR